MEVLEVLKMCKINGDVVILPEIQLERKTYQDVAKKIELIGGKWNKKQKGFLFQQDPSELFADICNGDNRNLKKEFQFFETPEELANELCSYIPNRPLNNVLEPSAGRGAIVRAINKVIPNVPVYYCEAMELNRKQFNGDAEFIGEDFFDIEQSYENIIKREMPKFDLIIANPPFSKNQDIDHFMKMVEVCKDGGCIISIMSKHWQNSSNKKETAFRDFIYSRNAEVIDIEAGKFKESGTMVSSCIVIVINKETTNKQRKEDIMTNKKDELERHPQTEDLVEEIEDDNEGEYEEEECSEETETVIDEDEADEEDEEMTKSEARDYVDEQIDEDFMDDVTPEKMTPEKAAKEIKKLEEDIKSFKERADKIEAISTLYDNDGLKILIEEIQSLIEKSTRENEIKDLKSGTKILEAALLITSKIQVFKSEYDNKISGIKSYTDSIERIKAQGFQPSLFEQQEETVAEVEQPTLASEVEEEAAGV